MKFNIEKETSTVKFMLEKHNIPSITAEVIAVLDVSGSTQNLYYNGAMQDAVQRVVPIALNFDDNGDIPVYLFDTAASQTNADLTQNNYADFVQTEILNKNLATWGGTSLSPVLKSVVKDLGFFNKQLIAAAPAPSKKGFWKNLFGNAAEAINNTVGSTTEPQTQSTSKLPAIVYVITDGENDDHNETTALLQSLQDAGSEVYFNFIGVGDVNFRYLTAIADKFDNVGFAQIADIAAVASGGDQIYDYLIPEELTVWLKKFVTK